MKVYNREEYVHLRKYFLFNYENYYRVMIDNDLIGLSGFEKDLSVIFNDSEPEKTLKDVMKSLEVNSSDQKSFMTFLFDIDIEDAICLTDNKFIYAIGIVESNYQFTPNKDLPHAKKVKWISNEKISIEDGNPRIKIREITKEETYNKVEAIINDKLIEDEGTIVNCPSRITKEAYINFFNEININPYEKELLTLIYSSGKMGSSIFELQKSFINVDVEESIENFAKKISRDFRIKTDDDFYTPNLFNRRIRDGHMCLSLKDELAQALLETGIIDLIYIENENTTYTIAKAQQNSVYAKEFFEEALSLLEEKKSLSLIGDWCTGKSYFAHRLALLLIGSRNLDNILKMKMHSSLKYENLFDRNSKSKFIRFIEHARKNSIENFVIILEDCHEVDLVSVFGEMAYLIRDNNRDRESALDVEFNDNKYFIPKNVYVISTARDTGNMFKANNLNNVLIFEMETQFSQRFISMFEDYELGRYISETYTKVNEVTKDYGVTFNHGLFLKKSRGINQSEYQKVLKYKIKPIIKRLIPPNEVEMINKLIEK